MANVSEYKRPVVSSILGVSRRTFEAMQASYDFLGRTAGNKISVLVVQPELSAIPGIGEAGANQAMYGHVVQRGVS